VNAWICINDLEVGFTLARLVFLFIKKRKKEKYFNNIEINLGRDQLAQTDV